MTHHDSQDTNSDPNSTVRPSVPSTRRRTGLAIGLSAGLLGGAAAGMAFGIPGVSSAAVEGSPTGTDVSALVAQADDTTTDDTTVDDTTVEDTTDEDTMDDDRVERHTERVRTALDELVTDGTITAEQADAVAAHLAEHGPVGEHRGPLGPGPFGEGGPFGDGGRLGDGGPFGGGGRFDGRGPFGGGEVIADLLGLDGDTLRDELRSGSTLAEIAEANGGSADDVIDALVADAMERLDRAVEDGRIDEATADERRDDIEDRITELVTTPRGER